MRLDSLISISHIINNYDHKTLALRLLKNISTDPQA